MPPHLYVRWYITNVQCNFRRDNADSNLAPGARQHKVCVDILFTKLFRDIESDRTVSVVDPSFGRITQNTVGKIYLLKLEFVKTQKSLQHFTTSNKIQSTFQVKTSSCQQRLRVSWPHHLQKVTKPLQTSCMVRAQPHIVYLLQSVQICHTFLNK